MLTNKHVINHASELLEYLNTSQYKLDLQKLFTDYVNDPDLSNWDFYFNYEKNKITDEFDAGYTGFRVGLSASKNETLRWLIKTYSETPNKFGIEAAVEFEKPLIKKFEKAVRDHEKKLLQDDLGKYDISNGDVFFDEVTPDVLADALQWLVKADNETIKGFNIDEELLAIAKEKHHSRPYEGQMSYLLWRAEQGQYLDRVLPLVYGFDQYGLLRTIREYPNLAQNIDRANLLVLFKQDQNIALMHAIRLVDPALANELISEYKVYIDLTNNQDFSDLEESVEDAPLKIRVTDNTVAEFLTRGKSNVPSFLLSHDDYVLELTRKQKDLLVKSISNRIEELEFFGDDLKSQIENSLNYEDFKKALPVFQKATVI